MPKVSGAFTLTMNPPFRDLRGRFTVAEKQLLEDRRELIRNQGRRYHSLIVDEAPGEEFPSKIKWRTFIEGQNLGFKVTAPDPPMSFIVEGTRPHTITPKGPGYPLRFFWERGPQGARTYFFYSVRHPGTKPNRFPGRALRRWLPGARVDLARVARNYTRTIAGSGTRKMSA